MQSSPSIPNSPSLPSQHHHQALTNFQPSNQNEVSQLLPRVPPATVACPRPWTFDQCEDWCVLHYWKQKQRCLTQTERDDWDECNRQINVWANESPSDVEEDEEMVDFRLRSALHRRQRPLSPPPTPPHLKGSKLYKNRHPGATKIEKPKAKGRTAPRRPLTRSQGWPSVSLHDRKGYIRFWRMPWAYLVISHDHYLNNYYREELDKEGPQKLDYSYEHPDRPFKTHWQREVCRRDGVHEADRKKEVVVSVHHRGNR